MMKIAASLVILGLCANLAFGAAPTSSSQASGFGTTYLNNSFVTKIYSAANSTDATNWDSSTAAVTGGAAATSGGVYSSGVFFGAGATNDTSYVYGITTAGVTTGSVTLASTATGTSYVIGSLRNRKVNNTIVGWGNDTTQANVISDTSISTSIQSGLGASWATGLGYLAAISAGPDGTTGTINNQVWVTIISGVAGSASSTKLTATADTQTYTAVGNVCTATSYGVGNIWYDATAGAFFYTYYKYVQSTAAQTTASASATCPSYTVSTYTIYLGGIFQNGTAYWSKDLAITPVTATNGISSLVSGPDNSLNATTVYVAYKDTTISPKTSYVSKTTKATSTSSAGSPSTLVADSTSGTSGTTTYYTYVYTPIAVWASNFTYGVTVANKTGTLAATAGATTTYTYTYTNYLNGTTTATDSGLTQPSGAGALAGFYGWQLNTGYTLLGVWSSATSPYPNSYVLGTFYGNGTVNATQQTIGTLTYGGISLYEDNNGTQWIGWQDVDTANSGITYAGYLAKLQGQLNVPSGASVLSAISAFFALFLAALFVF